MNIIISIIVLSASSAFAHIADTTPSPSLSIRRPNSDDDVLYCN